jgi:hypothetical protein
MGRSANVAHPHGWRRTRNDRAVVVGDDDFDPPVQLPACRRFIAGFARWRWTNWKVMRRKTRKNYKKDALAPDVRHASKMRVVDARSQPAAPGGWQFLGAV